MSLKDDETQCRGKKHLSRIGLLVENVGPEKVKKRHYSRFCEILFIVESLEYQSLIRIILPMAFKLLLFIRGDRNS